MEERALWSDLCFRKMPGTGQVGGGRELEARRSGQGWWFKETGLGWEIHAWGCRTGESWRVRGRRPPRLEVLPTACSGGSGASSAGEGGAGGSHPPGGPKWNEEGSYYKEHQTPPLPSSAEGTRPSHVPGQTVGCSGCHPHPVAPSWGALPPAPSTGALLRDRAGEAVVSSRVTTSPVSGDVPGWGRVLRLGTQHGVPTEE